MLRSNRRTGLALLIAATLATLAACNKNAPPDPQSRVIETFFTCGEQRLQVRFFPGEGRAVLIQGQASTELTQAPTGSGFRYSNGTTEIRGKGPSLTLTRPDQPPLNCREDD